MTRRDHTAWCAGGHLCNLGEHRAQPIPIDPIAGAGTVTRVRDANGFDHAEIRLRLRLTATDTGARRQLATLLFQLRDLLTRIDRLQGSDL